MCSETVPTRFSFSNDLSELQVLPMKQDVARKDTLLLDSNHEFEFSTSRSLEFESSSADELFSNGVILPIQIQQKRNTNTTRKHTRYGEPSYTRLPPLPCPSSVDKMKKERIREVANVNSGSYEQKTQFSSFWGFSRSKSLNCDIKKSLMCSSPPLSRSNSTGSVPTPKRMSSNKHPSAAKPLSSSSSSCSSLNFYPVQKSPSGKCYGGSYANGVRISPVLNLPTPCISKGSVNLFGLGSFLRVGKAKKSKK
ncbi:uncharacterized protein LOC113855801 [Abrus precatorius]|uniref:Uncharacterized protein LOC113855801 n=1 Tax=Abrus precatorius TaxID=3816 RepID=A0A8B8KHD7_ABRPR|nr:uncharacterized protein LOC113855801 [Abrus precatorius]